MENEACLFLEDMRVLVRISEYRKRKLSFSVGQASTGTNQRVWKVKNVFFWGTDEYWYESTSMESEKCSFFAGQESTGTNMESKKCLFL